MTYRCIRKSLLTRLASRPTKGQCAVRHRPIQNEPDIPTKHAAILAVSLFRSPGVTQLLGQSIATN